MMNTFPTFYGDIASLVSDIVIVAENTKHFYFSHIKPLSKEKAWAELAEAAVIFYIVETLGVEAELAERIYQKLFVDDTMDEIANTFEAYYGEE